MWLNPKISEISSIKIDSDLSWFSRPFENRSRRSRSTSATLHSATSACWGPRLFPLTVYVTLRVAATRSTQGHWFIVQIFQEKKTKQKNTTEQLRKPNEESTLISSSFRPYSEASWVALDDIAVETRLLATTSFRALLRIQRSWRTKTDLWLLKKIPINNRFNWLWIVKLVNAKNQTLNIKSI